MDLKVAQHILEIRQIPQIYYTRMMDNSHSSDYSKNLREPIDFY